MTFNKQEKKTSSKKKSLDLTECVCVYPGSRWFFPCCKRLVKNSKGQKVRFGFSLLQRGLFCTALTM